MADVLVRAAAVAGGELVRKDFAADSVDRAGEVAVGNRGVPGFDAPQVLAGRGGERQRPETGK